MHSKHGLVDIELIKFYLIFIVIIVENFNFIGMMYSSPLPDWAIISIALTLVLSVIAGGSLKKRDLRQQLMKLIPLFFQNNENNRNSNSINENNSKDIEL